MKASIKFRDEQKPLFKAKLPFSILGFPLQSEFIAGEKRDLCLTFNTIFTKGPSIKLSYRPNDSCNHLTFGIKAAVGFAPITVSAKLNLLGANRSPAFFLHFKPQLGDFSIRRSLQSHFSHPCYNKHQLQDSREDNEDQQGSSINSNAVGTMFCGLELNARTALPVKEQAVVRFQWNVKFQECDPMAAEITYMAIMPSLVLNKVGIESSVGNKRDCLGAKKELDFASQESDSLRRGKFEGSLDRGQGDKRKCLLRRRLSKIISAS